MFETVTLFHAPNEDYCTYRIPALMMTGSGTLLALCEARRGNGGDWDPNDIVVCRSTDQGRTWSASHILAGDGKATYHNTTTIVDHITDTIHVIYHMNYSHCFIVKSADDGKTFSAPDEITSVFERFRAEYDWNVIASGPGHAIQLRNGRLIVPVWLSTGGEMHRPSCVSVIYSDDHGQSWQRGDMIVRHSTLTPNPSETVVLELADGRVMVNIRNESPRCRRLISYSADGATNWSEPRFDEGLYEPVCMASMVRVPVQSKTCILFANPDSHMNPTWFDGWARVRENLTVKASYDEGDTWTIAKVISPGISGYSDLAVGQDLMIYCLYESGAYKQSMFRNTSLSLTRFDLAWLTD